MIAVGSSSIICTKVNSNESTLSSDRLRKFRGPGTMEEGFG